MLRNRPEFHLVDTAVMHLGAIPFSIYTTSPPNQIRYLFTNAENTIVVTEKEFLPAVKAAGDDLAHVIVVDDDADGCLSLDELESRGADTDFDFDSAWRAVQPDDVATLIYTSGTTGPPKGVELTHANVMAEFSATVGLVSLQPTDRLISYLPHAHIADRVTGHYANLVLGVPVTDVADLTTIAQALTDVRPTVWLGVPRVWHKIKSGIETTLGEASGVKRRLALWAIDTGIHAGRHDAGRQARCPHRLPFVAESPIAWCWPRCERRSAWTSCGGGSPAPPPYRSKHSNSSGAWAFPSTKCGVSRKVWAVRHPTVPARPRSVRWDRR